VLIGLNEAIVLQQLHFWLEKNESKPDHHKAGRVWAWNSYDSWRKKQFPFWGLNTVIRAFNSLEKRGLIIQGCFNKFGFDKTRWYTIDYSAVAALTANCPMDLPKMGKSFTQIDTIDTPKMSTPIPETTAETTTKSEPASKLANPKPKPKPKPKAVKPEAAEEVPATQEEVEEVMRDLGMLGPSDPGDDGDHLDMTPVVFGLTDLVEEEEDIKSIIVPDYEEALERQSQKCAALPMDAASTAADGPPSVAGV
jgi:hypothetical protein